MIALLLLLIPIGAARGATVIDGPIDLGTSAAFGVLGASAVTSTGPTVVGADVGVSPGTSITGFPPGTLTPPAVFHPTDAVAAQAQVDLLTAMSTAASLTPIVSGLADLTGMSLTPGVYSGGALSIDGAGTLTLAGTDPTSVWVFTAASTLITGSLSQIVITGGASACNVFWRVGSSATFGTGTQFSGTVMAEQSITAETSTVVVGRLLAANGAVTLDSTEIVPPSPCAATPGTVSTNGGPVFTSTSPSGGTVGTPYSFTFTTTGAPAASYAVTAGSLPAGLILDGATGVISGLPTAPGTSAFTITATNGVAPDASVITSLVVAAAAAASAATLPPAGPAAIDLVAPAVIVLTGIVLLVVAHRRPARHRMSR